MDTAPQAGMQSRGTGLEQESPPYGGASPSWQKGSWLWDLVALTP